MAGYTPNMNRNNEYVDDSLIFTPKPQATSTVVRPKTDNSLNIESGDEFLADSKRDVENSLLKSNCEGIKKSNFNQDSGAAGSKFLFNERDLVGSLKKELDKVMADIRRESVAKQSVSSTSSLGIVKLDVVEDFGVDDTSKVLDNLEAKIEDDCEMSWRMMKRLARESISCSRKSSLSAGRSIGSALAGSLPKINSSEFTNVNLKINFADLVTQSNELKKSLPAGDNKISYGQSYHRVNPFDGERCSVISLPDEEFTSGENAATKLLQDEAAWFKEKAEIPVEVEERSLSGIFPDDDRFSTASSYLRKGSGPIGNLNGTLDSDSRPNFGSTIFSLVKPSDLNEDHSHMPSNNYSNLSIVKHFGKSGPRNYNDNTLDKIPTKDLTSNGPISNDKRWNNMNQSRKTIIISNNNNDNGNSDKRKVTLMSDSDAINNDRLSVSSVASITHIAELLGDMSINASPRLIIDKMLSAGSSRDRDGVGVTNGNQNCSNQFSTDRKCDKLRSKLNIKEDVKFYNCEEDKGDVILKELTKTMDRDIEDSVMIISDGADQGKENENESVWIIPSRAEPVCGGNISKDNNSNVFKIPDNKNFIKRGKSNLPKEESKMVAKSNRILSDSTNISHNPITDCKLKTTKRNNPSIVDVETNVTFYEEELDKSMRVSNITESQKDTRYSSSNVSSINNYNVKYIADTEQHNEHDDIYNFDIMHVDKLLQYSSIEELNFNHKKNDEIILKIDNSNIDVNNDKYIINVNEVCLSDTDMSYVNCNVTTSISTPSGGGGDFNNVNVCVGSLVKCTIPINSLPEAKYGDCPTMICSLSVNNIVCDKKLILNSDMYDKIVRLFFPEEIVLEGNKKNKDIEVHVVPLVAKCIEISLLLKLAAVDDSGVLGSSLSPSVVNCLLKVTGEYPQITIEPKSLTETVFDGINFGLLPEESLEKSFIKLKNNSNVRVPILLEISKLSSDILIFYMIDYESNSGKEVEVMKKLIIMEPGETIEEPIYCFTPPLPQSKKGENCKIGQVSGHLFISIASIENSSTLLPKLAQLELLVLVGQTRVLIAAHCNPLTIPVSQVKTLLVRNAGVTSVVLKLHCDNPLFSVVGEKYISLEPDENGTVGIHFTLDTTNSVNKDIDTWKGTLWLSVISSEVRYSVDLQGQQQLHQTPHQVQSSIPNRPSSSASMSSSGGSNGRTPLTPRSSSPCSSYGRSSGDMGPLELACTCSALVWASCPLLQNNTVNKKSCVLRNKRNHREKLLLTVSDPLSSYKIVEEKGTLVAEMRLNLEGMESRQITVSFNPTQVGPCKGSLIITRLQRKSVMELPVPSQKKVLHLYGYGGKSVLNIKGVFRDPELRMWTYLDSSTLQTTFTLENTGDGTAFVKLGQEIAATGVKIVPEECLIAAHKSINVELTFFPTAGRADHLLSEPNAGEVLNVTRITITHGDEATRLRLKRLYCRLLNDKQKMDTLLLERLAVLNNLFPGTSINEISMLKDKLEGMKTLWVEGIRESTVGVLLERSTLENAQLDSTAQFIDLANTIMDETVCASKLQQLIVAPRVVTLSQLQPVSSFSLRNTTVLQSRFHVEMPQTSFDFIVEPQNGTLSPHTSCLLTVKHIPSIKGSSSDQFVQNSASILKIHSDLMSVIEVPVNWSRM